MNAHWLCVPSSQHADTVSHTGCVGYSGEENLCRGLTFPQETLDQTSDFLGCTSPATSHLPLLCHLSTSITAESTGTAQGAVRLLPLTAADREPSPFHVSPANTYEKMPIVWKHIHQYHKMSTYTEQMDIVLQQREICFHTAGLVEWCYSVRYIQSDVTVPTAA